MRALPLLALLALAASAPDPAAAQTVTARGGEHETFTRLVLGLPAGAAWDLAPVPGGFELSLPPGAEVDLSAAFDKIPRDRLRALTPLGEGRLGLAVTCDCHAVTSYYYDDLVIDVADGPAPPGAIAPGPAPAPASATPAPVVVATGLVAFPLLPSAPAPAPLPFPLPPAPTGPAAPEAEAPEAEAPGAPAQAAQVAETEAAILQGFSRAASQGLLDLAPARELPDPEEAHDEEAHAEAHAEEGHAPPPEAAAPDAHAAPAATAHDAPIPDVPAHDVPPLGAAGHEVAGPAAGEDAAADPLAVLAAEAGPQLSLRTSIDRDAPAVAQPLAAEGATCLGEEALDLAAWAGEDGFAAAIAARTAALSNERDAWEDGAVEALARAYLAYGFGREAAHALGLDGRASAERDLLLLLAAVVDGDPVPAGALADQGGCLGPVALWRGLARGTLEGTGERERTAAAHAVRTLPEALRGHLSVRLAGLFLDAGDGPGAEAVIALAEGTATAGGTEAAHAGAAIAEAVDGPAPAIAELTAIAEADARMTPEAVIDLIDLSLDEGRPIAEDTLLLARSLRFEHRDDDLGPALLLAEVRALTGASLFEDALILIQEGQGVLSPADAAAALEATVAELAAELADGPFLETALLDLPERLPAAAAGRVAARLRALGFAPEADAVLARAEPPVASPNASPSGPGPDAAPEVATHEPPATAEPGHAEPAPEEPAPEEPTGVTAPETASGEEEEQTTTARVEAPAAPSETPATEPAVAVPVRPEAAPPVPEPFVPEPSGPEPSGPEPAAVEAAAVETAGIEAVAPPAPGPSEPIVAEAVVAEAVVAEAEAVAAAPATLAERQALLDAAAEARERATALLGAGAAD